MCWLKGDCVHIQHLPARLHLTLLYIDTEKLQGLPLLFVYFQPPENPSS